MSDEWRRCRNRITATTTSTNSHRLFFCHNPPCYHKANCVSSTSNTATTTYILHTTTTTTHTHPAAPAPEPCIAVGQPIHHKRKRGDGGDVRTKSMMLLFFKEYIFHSLYSLLRCSIREHHSSLLLCRGSTATTSLLFFNDFIFVRGENETSGGHKKTRNNTQHNTPTHLPQFNDYRVEPYVPRYGAQMVNYLIAPPPQEEHHTQ